MKKISRLLLFLAVVLAVIGINSTVGLNAKTKTKKVGSVKELEAELQNEKAGKIVLKTDNDTTFIIPVCEHGNNKDLVIETPNATVENNSVFKSITVKSAKKYTEKANGNKITLKASGIAFNVSESALVDKLNIYSKKADIILKADAQIVDLDLAKKSSKISLNFENGYIDLITFNKKAQLTISGKATDIINIDSKAKGSNLITAVPVYLYAYKNMKMTLKKDSGNSTIVYVGKNINVKIKNKSGKEIEKIIIDTDEQDADTEKKEDDATFKGKKTSIKKKVTSTSIYTVYEAPSNVVQFKGPDGSFYFAVAGDKKVTVYKVKNGEVLNEKIELSKPHTVFGTVTCDEDGYFYLVTGENHEIEGNIVVDENNECDEYKVKTVFVSKYDSNGKHIKTSGYTGRTGVKEDDFNTQYPFDCGCSAVVMNGIITVNYSRGMYNTHQSSNTFAMYTSNLQLLNFDTFYNSHSFGQRAITVPENNTFILASHGDWAPRADRIAMMRILKGQMISYEDFQLFHFYNPKGDDNNTYACMGGIAKLSYDRLVLVGDSAVSGDSSAPDDSREIFIQIFNPLKDLNSEEAYYTTGTRTGYRETNEGRIDFTDHGVKWLTSYGKGWYVSNVQFTVTDDDRIVILYELYKSDTAKNDLLNRNTCEYQGVYYMILDANGEILSDAKLYDKNALLNPFQMPVFSEGKIYWVDNKYDKEDRNNEKNTVVYLYELDPGPAPENLFSIEESHKAENVVAIDKSSFPDDFFREYVCAFADVNKDMYLDEKEIGNVYKIDFGHLEEVFGKDKYRVKDLKGIEYFTSLEYLDCSNNQLTHIDISKNTALLHLDCSRTQLTGLDVKNNKDLIYLDCHENQITDLDISENVNLDCFKCGANRLASIDVSKNTELTVFICDGNEFSGLDVSKNLKLIEFNCACNFGITSLDVKNNTNLEVFICYCSSLKELDVRNNKELINLNYGVNQISSIDLSNNTKLEFLGSGYNEFESIDLSHNPLLKVMELSENKLTKLDLTHNPSLEKLHCDKNKLTSLDLSNNPNLVFINGSYNQFVSIDFSHNPQLTEVDLSENKLSKIDLGHNPSLTILNCENNNFTSLDISNNPELVELNCKGNPLQSLDISGNENLEKGLTYDVGLNIITK